MRTKPSLYAPVSLDLALTTQVALVTLSRSLRPYLRKGKAFVAALLVPSNSDINHYSEAAQWLLDAPRRERMIGEYDHAVIVIDAERARDSTADRLEGVHKKKRVVVLVSSLDQLSDELKIMADVIGTLPPPTSADIRIAAKRMGFGNIRNEDASFLAAQDMSRVSLAMRRGRPIETVVDRLQQYPPIEKQTSAIHGQTEGPKLEDLSGYGDAKSWGLELAKDLADLRDRKVSWEDIDRGILLSGPPGSGKTSFASALARSCNASLVVGSAASWQAAGHLGDMLKAMRRAFSEAEKHAPSILFIDEFDSFGDRSTAVGDNSSYSRQVINALLESLDGIKKREGVVVVGATNFPELIDAALLRPGRLERHFVISMPDDQTRDDLFRFFLGTELQGQDLRLVVSRSLGWSGAAIECCVRDARRTARRAQREMRVADLLSAMPTRIPIPPDMLRSTAVHEMGHAVVGVLVEADRLLYVSIQESYADINGAQMLGSAVYEVGPIVRKTSTYFENRIAILLAGVAAEQLVYGDHSDGAGGHQAADLNLATDLATMMEVKWGFGQSLISVAADHPDHLEVMRSRQPLLTKHVETTLRTQMERASRMLEQNREVLEFLAEQLILRGRLEAREIKEAVLSNRQTNMTAKAKAG